MTISASGSTQPGPPLGLAMIGLGTVGSGVVRLLREQSENLSYQAGRVLELRWVMVRDLNKSRTVSTHGLKLTTRLEDILHDEQVEIVLELMGGVDPTFDIICQLLASGKHVVTANKAVLAERGSELFRKAHHFNRTLEFEASVAGGIPILAAVSESLAADQILSLSGILNGTCNYILSAMSRQGTDYQEALQQAQQLGFAEADPTLDVSGLDAAQKLAILARLAFQATVEPSRIARVGIDHLDLRDLHYAAELGYVVKLLATARLQAGQLHLAVVPTLVAADRPLAQIHGEYNAVQVIGEAMGDHFYVGKGAGPLPTASSVLTGVLDLAVGRGQATFKALRLWEEGPHGPPLAAPENRLSRFYLRFTIRDQAGTLAQIASILGELGISIVQVRQDESTPTPRPSGNNSGRGLDNHAATGTMETQPDEVGVPLVILTHPAREGAVRQAIQRIDQLAIVRQPTVCLHVES